ncbi:hypothetical protein Sps_02723 [Shewanella psychrophila]|uniref:Lipoprotein n=1 Tax=Shewanella psychrophila TaxID=225848 RepID=A0A1S6HQR5_9GAMM|nr:hypothetical protein [Shewanella psychrophila]AQS37875.1 hypothetical protein Sps_02723 [Shewanella psychrophila]
MKHIALSLLTAALLSGCGATKTASSPALETNKAIAQTEIAQTEIVQTQKVEKTVKQVTKLSNLTDDKTVYILMDIPFRPDSHIADNIENECAELGNQFSNSVLKYAKKQKLSLKAVDQLPANGKVLKLSIDDVYSAGNAFIGHRKSASITASYLVDGEMLATTEKTRNSGGGFFGGFKGSCSVLAHTVNTLGNDVAKWLKQQTN